MTNLTRIALILGSTREGRFCDTVATWVASELGKQDNLKLTIIDPATLALPHRHEKEINAAVRDLQRQLDQADAFLVVTPEYNHSFPAALKFLIDSASREWQTKPVAFVSYGGISGGLRAVEQLRQVFAELHTVTVRDSVSFASVWDQFSEDGQLRNPQRAQSTLSRLLAQLTWWAQATKTAREIQPYGQAG